MIGPRKKRSIADKHTRNAKWQRTKITKLLKAVNYTTCTNCGEEKLNHRVCPACGVYKGEQVMAPKTKEKVLEA